MKTEDLQAKGLTDEQMDDTINWMSINNRKNASMDELAIERRTYEEIAKEAWLMETADDVRIFLNNELKKKVQSYADE